MALLALVPFLLSTRLVFRFALCHARAQAEEVAELLAKHAVLKEDVRWALLGKTHLSLLHMEVTWASQVIRKGKRVRKR